MNYNWPKSTFILEADRLYVGLPTTCLMCGGSFSVGPAAWVFRVGHERIGYFCPRCLNETARERMAQAAAKVNQRTSDDDERGGDGD